MLSSKKSPFFVPLYVSDEWYAVFSGKRVQPPPFILFRLYQFIFSKKSNRTVMIL